MSSNPVEEQNTRPKKTASEKWEIVQGFLWLFLAPLGSTALAIGKLGGIWPAMSWWIVVGPVALWAAFFGAIVFGFLIWVTLVNLQSR